jgi:RNA polymerase sigma-70 factor, ECF subfamily
MDYEQVVALFYEGLYRFGYSLARNQDDACELTQETFARLLAKGGHIRDHSKVKAWLFTTLYRIYLGWKRREARLPHFDIDSVEHELPLVTPEIVDGLEHKAVLQSLLEMEEHHRVPLTLFYLENRSYREIADLLDISIGTVMSRLSRAKAALRAGLAAKSIGLERKIVSIHQASQLKLG